MQHRMNHPFYTDEAIVKQEDNCTVISVKDDQGEVNITEYKAFPGIYLLYKEINLQNYHCLVPYESSYIEINYCIEGRFEYKTEDSFFSITKGDLSIHRMKEGYIRTHYPFGQYKGISILLDTTQSSLLLANILDEMDIDIYTIKDKYCKDRDYYVLRSNPQLETIFSGFYSVSDHVRKGYQKLKIIELLLYLCSVDTKVVGEECRCCSHGQMQLAKEISDYIEEHMNEKLTIDQLSSLFHISSTHLKKCFRCVYGEPVSTYIRKQKMLSAAKMLKKTDRTILDIAGEHGYENGGKFSKAFFEIIGVSPKEYRQLGKYELAREIRL